MNIILNLNLFNKQMILELKEIISNSLLGIDVSELKTAILAAIFGAIFAYILLWLFKGRRLNIKIIKRQRGNIGTKSGHTFIVSVYNPNDTIASLYNFKAITKNREKIIIEKDEYTNIQPVLLVHANKSSQLEEITYINPKSVYPLKILFVEDECFKKDPITKVSFYSKTCGFFKSKFQIFFSGLEQQYSIPIYYKYQINQSCIKYFLKRKLDKLLRV